MLDLASLARLTVALDRCSPFGLLEVASRRLAEEGALGTVFLMADYGGVDLCRLGATNPPSTLGTLPVHGTAAGHVLLDQKPAVVDDERGARVLVPVSVRGERLGVLEVLLPERPPHETVTVLAQLAVRLAHALAAARRYTDFFERVRRRQDLDVGAELQWELLPVLDLDAEAVTLSGVVEPAYEIAGDNFDYALEPDALTLSITDAMGHGTEAALLCGLAVSALRNARRRGRGLAEQAANANTALHANFTGDFFATGLLFRLEFVTGRLTAVCAGHPPARRVRWGDVEAISLPPDLPYGLFPDTAYTEHEVGFLELGDRLVLVSDGVIEAATDAGDQFGPDGIDEVLVQTRGLPPFEAVRALTDAVLAHHDGGLRDDVTVVCLDWRGA